MNMTYDHTIRQTNVKLDFTDFNCQKRQYALLPITKIQSYHKTLRFYY